MKIKLSEIELHNTLVHTSISKMAFFLRSSSQMYIRDNQIENIGIYNIQEETRQQTVEQMKINLTAK